MHTETERFKCGKGGLWARELVQTDKEIEEGEFNVNKLTLNNIFLGTD